MLHRSFKRKLFSSSLLIFLILSTTAQASHHNPRLGQISVAGSGCQSGRVGSTRINRLTGHLIIAPENYVATLEKGTQLNRKSCNFALPFEGVPNRAVRIRKPRIIGNLILAPHIKAQVNYEMFFVAFRGRVEKLEFGDLSSPLEKSFDHTTVYEEIYECGKSGIIRGNSSIVIQSSDPESTASFIEVEKFGIKIDTVPCQ